MAPGMCPLAHSLSSRTSTRTNCSPASARRFTSGTFVSLTFFFASLTSFRNCGEWTMARLLLDLKFSPGKDNPRCSTGLLRIETPEINLGLSKFEDQHL